MRTRPASAVLALILAAGAVRAQTPLDTSFTYQGRLTDNGSAPTGSYDFQFKLFDALANGNQVGNTVPGNDLSVVAGLFTTTLNFGAQFGGSKRWLQIEVRPGASTGGFTVLGQRQELTAAPNALFSELPWATGASGISYTGNVGIGTATPQGKLDIAAGDSSYVRVDATYGDLHVNGGTDGNFGIGSEGAPTGSFNILSGGLVRLCIRNDTGNVGIGTSAPTAKLQVESAGQYSIYAYNTSPNVSSAVYGAAGGTNINSSGVFGESGGSSIGVKGTALGGTGVYGESFSGSGVYGNNTNTGVGVRGVSVGGDGVTGTASALFKAGVNGGSSHVNGWGGYFYNTAVGGVALKANGICEVNTLRILGGSDLAEPFDVAAVAGQPIVSGMVVVIDPANPGKLRLTDSPYDAKVAGVISGANGLAPGMVMKAEGQEKADGQYPIAMTGRVWVWCDAATNAISPGDRLTTSHVPGHAMKADEAARAPGAVIGKAMTELKEGKGLVLVLVNLQ